MSLIKKSLYLIKLVFLFLSVFLFSAHASACTLGGNNSNNPLYILNVHTVKSEYIVLKQDQRNVYCETKRANDIYTAAIRIMQNDSKISLLELSVYDSALPAMPLHIFKPRNNNTLPISISIWIMTDSDKLSTEQISDDVISDTSDRVVGTCARNNLYRVFLNNRNRGRTHLLWLHYGQARECFIRSSVNSDGDTKLKNAAMMIMAAKELNSNQGSNVHSENSKMIVLDDVLKNAYTAIDHANTKHFDGLLDDNHGLTGGANIRLVTQKLIRDLWSANSEDHLSLIPCSTANAYYGTTDNLPSNFDCVRRLSTLANE